MQGIVKGPSVFLSVLLWLVVGGAEIRAATVIAASCSTSSVQSAVDAASNGDTVLIPEGSCAWSTGIRTAKQIWIRAQNYTPTAGGNATRNVTLTNNAAVPLFAFTTGDSFHTALSGIRINEGTGSNNAVEVNGNGAKVMLMSDMFFEVKQRNGSSTEVAVLDWAARGGVIWNTRFVGLGTGGVAGVGSEGTSWIVKGTPRIWHSVSTMGSLDTSGTVNLYMEDSSCQNVGQFPDLDDHGRVVVRYSSYDGCSGVTHGFTSAWGGRHAEYYNNTFAVTNSERNHNGRYYWIRAGTAVFTDNTVNNSSNPGAYGSVTLLDSIVEGSGSYPKPRQAGRGNNGSCPTCDQNASNPGDIPDPVYIWNNTGSRGSTFQTSSLSMIQLDRDVFVDKGAKPGYAKYAYPHPLRSALSIASGPDTAAPSAPTNLTATPSSVSQIDLSWSASTDNVGVSGYRVERCAGSACSNFTQIATPVATSYADSGLQTNTTYRYRILATDAAGNTSGYSAIATAATVAGGPDTTAPTVPSNTSAVAASFSQINVSWTAATDNVGVAGYVLQRCQGTSCTNFASHAAPATTSFADTGLAASTEYRYRVAARDAAGNTSNYSSIATATTPAAQSGAPPALPEGTTGIAALYPGDTNITAHPSVIFADNFESYTTASQLTTNWSQLFQQANARIATETANVYAGAKALEFRVPQQSAEVANAALKLLSPTEDRLFVRVYTKFESAYNALGSSHNGISISANYSNPGVPADGVNKFYVDLENSRDLSSETTPGLTNVYVYHPEQRSQWGDHWYPDGRVVPFDLTPGNFGPYFTARPNFTPALNRWYCYELMVQANTPGQRDGRIAAWIDGMLVADFQNVRLRDVGTLKIDKFDIGLHIGSNTIRPNLKWYDNVVAARNYIGPMSLGSSSVAPPTALTATVK